MITVQYSPEIRSIKKWTATPFYNTACHQQFPVMRALKFTLNWQTWQSTFNITLFKKQSLFTNFMYWYVFLSSCRLYILSAFVYLVANIIKYYNSLAESWKVFNSRNKIQSWKTLISRKKVVNLENSKSLRVTNVSKMYFVKFKK